MIKNYLYTIGKYLPASQREEILRDIEVNIYDFLEANYGESEYTNEEISNALYKMGKPKKVAENYMGAPRYLIGPRYIDTYHLVIKVALLGISIAMLVASTVKFIFEENLLGALLTLVSGVWNAGLITFALVTIVFSIIERQGEKEGLDPSLEDEDWNVDSLETAPEDKEKIKVPSLIIESVFIVTFLLLINFVSIPSGIYGNLTVIFFNPRVISQFILWINIVLLSSLLLNLYLLVKRHWNRLARILSLSLDLAGVSVFATIVFTPGLLDFTAIPGLSPDEITAIETAVDMGLKIGLVAIVIIVLIDVFMHVKSLVAKKVN